MTASIFLAGSAVLGAAVLLAAVIVANGLNKVATSITFKRFFKD